MTTTEKQRILVTVKTYPTLSRKYGETVCTAGIREDGTWVRIYPVPFRRLDASERYQKYDWIECRLARRTADPRPESFSPADQNELTPVGHIDTSDKWRERRRLLLQTAQVYNRLDRLIEGAKSNTLSLAVFKPTKVTNFIWEEEDRNWNQERLHQMRALHSQLALFEDNSWRQTFQLIPKLPYSFSYRFEDSTGKRSELQVLNWEAGALYWNCLKSTEGDEDAALAKVRNKYFDTFLKTDLHFFLGTTQQFHQVAPNPWVIIGVFPIPDDPQQRLF
ncbi:MAG: hypothetical protein F4Y91_05690 [Gemmatimonadetes bacterium]|nr:hypothetical protein [Gemmatimonadota bacterium]MXY81554.1 hypothetical protein [Gemmatimonadota bacterium]MYB68883.1 hypothetical protein [Gemmatimonadota bacterium]